VAPRATPALPSVTPAVAVEQDLPEVAIGKTRDEPRRVATGRPEAGQPASAAKPTSLAREVELIDGAMASLRTGDARAALVAIRNYDSETAGTGQLAEDAAAIQVEALCAIKDPTAVTRLATFDQRYPRSAQRSRLADACTR
nr:hypothetical protein [Deltaproteobacteria bacterium]